MTKINSEDTVKNLRDFCSRFGLPKKIISDNGKQLVSEEFGNFCKMNKIKHVTSAPYHSSCNGAAENAVKSFKRGLSKALSDPKNDKVRKGTLICRYLLAYRTTPHCFTGESLAKLVFKREIRTRFDLIKENYIGQNIERQKRNYTGKRNVVLELGDKVWIRDYRVQNKTLWAKGEIIECLGSRNYICRVVGEGLMWKRHIDQLRKAESFFDVEEGSNVNRPVVEIDTGNLTVPNRTVNKQNTISDLGVNVKDYNEDKENEVIVIRENESTVDLQNKEMSPLTNDKPEEILTENSVKTETNKDKNRAVSQTKQKMTYNVNERPKRVIKKPDRLDL